MPLYEYLCEECDSEFELLVRGSDKPACEKCGSAKLTQLLSVPAAHMARSAGSSAGGPSACELPVGGPCGMGGCGLPECG